MKMPKVATIEMEARKSQLTGWLNEPSRDPTRELMEMMGNADPMSTILDEVRTSSKLQYAENPADNYNPQKQRDQPSQTG